MVDASLRLLAVVPARGGSKRLPRKNVMPLGERPMIAWSIRAAVESGACLETLVSTDDDEIASAAREAGALVPWLRPAELATDTAPTGDVLAHALRWYEGVRGQVDAVLLLQPTSPFRSAASVAGAIQAFRDQPSRSRVPVVSVSPAASHPAWTFFLEDGRLAPCLGWHALRHRSQDLQAAYALNGSLYVIPAEDVREGRAVMRPGALPYVMTDPRESVDIDTAEDWARAQELAASWTW